MTTAGYSFAEACAMLGISAHTLRRRINDGAIRAERVARPQGYAWTVFLEEVPAGVTAAVTSEQPSAVTSNEPAAEPAETFHVQPAGAGTRSTEGQQLALVLAPLVEAAVAPIRAELADVRALLSVRDQELGAMRLERDQFAEQLAQISAAASAHAPADTTQIASDALRSHPWWRFWDA